jgi:hypothetical protein
MYRSIAQISDQSVVWREIPLGVDVAVAIDAHLLTRDGNIQQADTDLPSTIKIQGSLIHSSFSCHLLVLSSSEQASLILVSKGGNNDEIQQHQR